MTLPLTFLLGAGASYSYGIPMMIGFYEEFREYIKGRHTHCFTLLERFESNGHHQKADLETLLSDLETVLKAEEGLSLLGSDSKELASQLQIARELRGYLDAFIVDTCERFDREKVIHDFQSILALHRIAPLHIFSTNYDRIVEFACDYFRFSYSDGYETTTQPVANWTGQFDADVRIVKLHGSVNWYVDDPGGALHRLDRGYSLPAYDFRLTRSGQLLRPLMIIPTLEKEALGDPYIELAMRFTDVLKETRVLIVAGNSLRDRHIRSYIHGRINSLHVLLVGPRTSRKREIFGQPERTHALDAGFAEFLTTGGDAFQRLTTKLTALSRDDDAAVGVSIEEFIAETSRTINDESALATNPELAKLWREATEASPPIRSNAVTELSKHPHPAIVRRLVEVIQKDSEAAVRVSAVSSIMKLDPSQAVEILDSVLLTDQSQMVQMEAALGLIQLQDLDGAFAALQRAQQRTDINPSVRSVIEESLGGIKKLTAISKG
jgi:hypothetical protein